MFDPTAVYAPQTSAGAVAAAPTAPGTLRLSRTCRRLSPVSQLQRPRLPGGSQKSRCSLWAAPCWGRRSASARRATAVQRPEALWRRREEGSGSEAGGEEGGEAGGEESRKAGRQT